MEPPGTRTDVVDFDVDGESEVERSLRPRLFPVFEELIRTLQSIHKGYASCDFFIAGFMPCRLVFVADPDLNDLILDPACVQCSRPHRQLRVMEAGMAGSVTSQRAFRLNELLVKRIFIMDMQSSL